MEMERVKRLTLDINERLEEEDYQDMLASVCITAVQFYLEIETVKKIKNYIFVLDSASCDC